MSLHENYSVDIKALLRKITGVSFIKVLGAISAFYFQFILGNYLGAEGAGVYFQLLMVATICALVSRLGMDNVLLRHISSSSSSGDLSRVKSYILLSFIIIAFTLCIISLVVYFGREYILGFIDSSAFDLSLTAKLLPGLIISMAVSQLLIPVLLGLGRTKSSVLTEQFIPMFVAFSLCLSQRDSLTVDKVILIVVVSWLVNAFFSIFMLSKIVFRNRLFEIKAAPQDIYKSFINSSLSQFSIIVISRTNGWIGIAILSAYTSSFAVGQFSLAFRLASAASFILGAVNVVTAPKFSSLFAVGDIKKIEYLARKSSLVVGSISLVALVVTFFYGNEIMAVMGNDFSSSGGLLIIIMVGQVINAICGPVGNLLLMGGFEKEMRNVMLLSFTLSFFVHIILIFLYKEIGAAIATSVYMIAWNLMLVHVAQNKIGINILPFRWVSK